MSREDRIAALIGRSLAGAQKTREVSTERLCHIMGVSRSTLEARQKRPEKLTVEELLAVAPYIGLEIEIHPKGI
jgi:hypothetical protein